jgi:NAD(P)H dehydrogenase (quinone)
MIAITGAAGKTGSAVIRALAVRGQPVRGLVRRPEQQAHILAQGATEAVVGDLADPGILRVVIGGASAVYHICPNMHPAEEAIGRAVIAAAQEAEIQHFVYHSVLHPQVEAMPHHWQKLRVEEHLFTSGLPYTILQPTAYMQNLVAGWRHLVQEGLLVNPYPPATRLSLVDLADVAEAAATVLLQPGHAGAIYELVGTPPLSQHEVAAIIEQTIGRPVQAARIEIEAWAQGARQGGLAPYAVETLSRMFAYYAHYGLVGNPNVLRWLLGREPTSLAQFCTRIAQEEARRKPS